MALQTINVGNYINDGTGDDLRTAFVKVNDNFDEIYLHLGQNNTASNAGTGVGIFKEKNGVDLRFRSLVQSDGISVVNPHIDPNDLLSARSDHIVIKNTWPAINRITTDDNHYITTTTAPKSITISGDGSVHTTIIGDTITVDGRIQRETTPRLGANLDLNGYNITGNGIDLKRVNNQVNDFDFGLLSNPLPKSFIEWLMMQQNFDLGTYANPTYIDLDYGAIV